MARRGQSGFRAALLEACGQITAQALVTLGSMAPYVVAITGGSGKYLGAEGEIYVRPVSGTEGILTFDLQG